MRSFAGRDILSLKEFERNEFFHVFDVAQKMEPIARSRKNVDLLKEKTLVTAFYQPSTRTRLAHEVVKEVSGYFKEKVFRTIIPRNVRISEAPSFGKPINQYDPECIGARSYQKLAEEVLRYV
jgi:cellulose biosynthesis protein BcsQ